MFDPRAFILPPFRACPNCLRADTYGVLMIGGLQYTRRCRECRHSDQYPLPSLGKKVIYLDQMVISNMTKALHPTAAAGRKIPPYWRRLFERLDVLCRMQLAICPDSETHREESAVWTHPEALRRMYELLSHGVTFHDAQSVRQSQLMRFLENWLDGRAADEIKVERDELLHGTIDSWQERFTISAGSFEPEDWPERLNTSRANAAAALRKLSEQWQRAPRFSFKAVYKHELRAIDTTTIELHLRSMQGAAEVLAGTRPFDPDAFLPSNASSTILEVQHGLRERGVSEEDLWQKTVEFFTSPYLDQVPYLRISCMLFAAFARKAKSGQRRPAGRGTLNDVKTVATVMPTCDAIFVDNEVAALLAEEPLRSRIDYGTRIFSYRTRDQFIDYLDEIRKSVSEEHVAAVREVYGDGYLEPFTGLFESSRD